MDTGIFALKRREWLLLGALSLLSLVIHFVWRVHGFGEQDQARFGVYVLSWRTSGAFPVDTYVNRTSPLWLLYLRFVLDRGLPAGELADHLNRLNVVIGSLLLTPMYLLFRKLVADHRVALLAVVVYWFAPALWWGVGYGMPHIPAFAFLLVSFVGLVAALDKQGAQFALRILAAASALSVSAGLKSDILACGLAFPGLVWLLSAGSRRNYAAALSLPPVALVVTLLVSHHFIPVPHSVAALASNWSTQFPFDAAALRDAEHWQITIDGLGVVYWCAAAAGAVLCLLSFRRLAPDARARRLVLFALAWALPTVAFWAFIWAHAARHLTAPLCPLALLIVLGTWRLVRTLPFALAVVAGLIVANYHSAPATNHPNRLGPRLFESRTALQARVDRLQAGCERFASDPSPKKVLLGYWAYPYCEFALVSRAQRFTRQVITPAEHWQLELWEPQQSSSTLVEIRRSPPPRPKARDFPGWFVWDAELGRTPR